VALKRFPEFVRNSMDATGATVTCLPVCFDSGSWESAVFFQIGGKESKEDRRALSRLFDGVVPATIDIDVIKHNNASIVVIRFEVYSRGEDNPLIGEVLLTPGEIESHFQTLKLLSTQPVIRWFFADSAYCIIHRQQNRLGQSEHTVIEDVMLQATLHDALIRMTGQYDVRRAMNEVVSHYELRSQELEPTLSSSKIH